VTRSPDLLEPIPEREIRAAPWLLALATSAVGAFGLYFQSQPSWWALAMLTLPLLMFASVTLACLWVVAFSMAVSFGTWHRRAWLTAPAVGLVATISFALWLPFHLRFELSRPALESAAVELRNDAMYVDGTYVQAGRIGALDVHAAWREESAVYFELGCFIDCYGIVFDPDGETSYASSGSEPFAPHWYEWMD
jgi:membrane protein YdbS with pleckstrin-like domain